MNRNAFGRLLALIFGGDKRPAPRATPPPAILLTHNEGESARAKAAEERRHREVLAEQQRVRQSLDFASTKLHLYLLSASKITGDDEATQ